MSIKDVIVEKMDILKEMEVLNARMREAAVKDSTEEKIKAYDIGVENTMNCLMSLITHESDGEKDRLIYQKYGAQCGIVTYWPLEEVLKELGVEVMAD